MHKHSLVGQSSHLSKGTGAPGLQEASSLTVNMSTQPWQTISQVSTSECSECSAVFLPKHSRTGSVANCAAVSDAARAAVADRVSVLCRKILYDSFVRRISARFLVRDLF